MFELQRICSGEFREQFFFALLKTAVTFCMEIEGYRDQRAKNMSPCHRASLIFNKLKFPLYELNV